MRFKIDENLHTDVADLLQRNGHDAWTVHEQGLRGHADTDIASMCHEKARAIVTLDLDFADIRRYPPTDYHGIIVLRLNDQSRTSVMQTVRRIIALLDIEPLVGRLWIVDEQHVRIRE